VRQQAGRAVVASSSQVEGGRVVGAGGRRQVTVCLLSLRGQAGEEGR